jgi:hypothetical protein
MFQLSFALVFDLGLNRPVRENDGPEMYSHPSFNVLKALYNISANFLLYSLVDPSKSVAEINPREAKRTLDERRAFLSCYILTSW